MATKGNRQQFMDRLRAGAAGALPRKTVNEKLEKMVNVLLDEASKTGEEDKMTVEQKLAVGKLALQIEAVRNKLSDDDYGAGFMGDLPQVPLETENAE